MAYFPPNLVSQFTVGPSFVATYQTIQAAINAAHAGGSGVIYIQPGDYTENLTLYDKVELVGAASTGQSFTAANDAARIIGQHTPPASGYLSFTNIIFENAGDIFLDAGANTTTIALNNCVFELTANGFVINCVNYTSTASFVINNCFDASSAANGIISNTGGANIILGNCNEIGSGTAKTMVISGIANEISNCTINCPVTMQGTSGAFPINNIVFNDNVTFDGTTTSYTVTNSSWPTSHLTLNSSSSGTIFGCQFTSGASSCITMSSSGNWIIANSTIDSVATNAIAGTGAGTLTFGGLTFTGSNLVASTLTLGKIGGFTVAGDGAYNTFAGLSAGNSTLSGTENTGFGAPGGTGSPGVLGALTSGVSNCSFGKASSVAMTTSSNNSAFGHTSLSAVSTGSGYNSAYGWQTGKQFTTGAFNVLIGAGSGGNYTTSESSNIQIMASSSLSGGIGESNVLRIGTATGTGTGQIATAIIYGINGTNVGSTANVVTNVSDQLGTAVITAGTGVTIGTSANVITINAVGGGVSWSVITANQNAAVNHGYFCNKAGTLALALPATSAVGDTIEVANINTAAGTQFTQAAGQQIFFGATSTTSGATGTLTSNAVGDTLTMVCRTANTTWQVISSIGTWTAA